MKLAVLSDIHGNHYTFFKAIEVIEAIKVDYIFFCGDICGYYYGQNEIIEYMRNKENIVSVLGNHDKLFLDYLNEIGKSDLNRSNRSFDLLNRSISKENLNYLKSLPHERSLIVNDLKIGLFHGSPWDPINEYCYPDYNFEKYKTLEYDYIFQGHTHYKMFKRVNNIKIINPGSLGQPRDKGYPSFVIIDTTCDEIEFFDVQFDIEKLISEVKKNEDTEQPKYLINVLRRIGTGEKNS
ncbi:metallophosphoesterase family protein [Exiguobacterium aurantiacum]|uniref:metallophosphoesterase family protein n=1 Tax=Exiguobacterium aurantiacum TaxID=33987 RepID=UPI00384C1124